MSSKKTFVRALWGNCCFNDNDVKSSVKNDIHKILNNEYTEPFVTYVFGKDNYKYLKSLHIDCVLINPNPIIYDININFWRHKLDIFKYAMEDFDEIVYMDWDCIPTSKLPIDFWSRISNKSTFQANLMQYRTKRCLWRNKEWRKTCNGGFIYIADKKIPQKLVDIYSALTEWVDVQKTKREKQGKNLRFREKALIFDDEPAMSKYIDDLNVEWQGVDHYWHHHEPEFCNIKKSAYSQEQLKSKNQCFLHWV